ncbi:hypothetical protein IM660_03045 [Ruania alkalisoli]|uniref:Solute-binding protein family 5 domain-containing protein n=1 Tax=Ruania alkalisoli TaxID=2779775 RepID=A0A7M1SUN6_9MICO|nr:hypothetical protein [Ruania alkalisoli]QOR71296.1 hypothetical protein IM660_03045 [Ruania alkalisoli]
MIRAHRSARLILALIGSAVLIAACSGPTLPNSVIVGTTATVGWPGQFLSANAATVDATSGDLDVAAMTRSRFAELIDGVPAIDESFGTVEITDPEGFTVRYDLAEPDWSDGIPVDAADLLLAWAAGSNALLPDDVDPADLDDGDEGDDAGASANVPWFDSVPTGLSETQDVPAYDEFERAIEVTYPDPVVDWQTALDVAVPAHVVGALAFGLTDPMEAKQAVIDAIVEADTSRLATISRVWNDGFTLGDGDGSSIPEELLLSSGPYRVEVVDQARLDAQHVTLVVNTRYTGTSTPEYERIELTPVPTSDPLTYVGETLDVVQVPPTAPNRETTREMERLDYTVATSHTGELWALVLRSDRGEFSWQSAREAFVGAVPVRDVAEAGAGPWAGLHEITDVVLFPPGTDGHQIVGEDLDPESRFEHSEEDAIAEREAAGIESGTRICVLYDAGERYAVDAFHELRSSVEPTGWDVRDCGSDNLEPSLHDDGWDAVLTRIPIPETTDGISAQWGSDGPANLSGTADEERDALIDQLAHTADHYEARDIRVQIEASIIDESIVVPLTMDIAVTVSDRDIEVPGPRGGARAALMSGVVEWHLAD